MKTSTKVVLAGLAIAVTAGGAFAAQGWQRFGPGGWDGPGGRDGPRFGQRVFDRIDANKDGAISKDEMTQALVARFDAADTDKNGSLTKAEIVAAIDASKDFPRAHRFSGRMADQIVYRLDIDNNGAVERSELENRANKVFSLFDWNDDGKVEKTEIARTMPRMGHRHGMRHWWSGVGRMMPGWMHGPGNSGGPGAPGNDGDSDAG